MVEQERTGLLVDPGSVSSLAGALARLLADRQWCEQVGDSGRATALERYAEDRVIARFENLYRDLLARAEAPEKAPL